PTPPEEEAAGEAAGDGEAGGEGAVQEGPGQRGGHRRTSLGDRASIPGFAPVPPPPPPPPGPGGADLYRNTNCSGAPRRGAPGPRLPAGHGEPPRRRARRARPAHGRRARGDRRRRRPARPRRGPRGRDGSALPPRGAEARPRRP